MTKRMDGPMTAEYVRSILSFDPHTGVFVWLHGGFAGRVAGTVSKAIGYVLLSIGGRRYLGHRVAWLHYYGEWPKNTVDHINGAKADNRIANLRDIIGKHNTQNITRPPSSNTTGRLGVTTCNKTGKFVAQIHCDGKKIHLGQFDNVDDAHSAYVSAKRNVHKGNTL